MLYKRDQPEFKHALLPGHRLKGRVRRRLGGGGGGGGGDVPLPDLQRELEQEGLLLREVLRPGEGGGRVGAPLEGLGRSGITLSKRIGKHVLKREKRWS